MACRWPDGTITKRMPKKEKGGGREGAQKRWPSWGTNEGEIENKRGQKRQIRDTPWNDWRKGALELNGHLNPSSVSATGKCQIPVWVHKHPISRRYHAQVCWRRSTSRPRCERGVSLCSANRQRQPHTKEGRKAIKEHPTLGMDTARGRRKWLNNEVLECARSFCFNEYARILKINPSSHSLLLVSLNLLSNSPCLVRDCTLLGKKFGIFCHV